MTVKWKYNFLKSKGREYIFLSFYNIYLIILCLFICEKFRKQTSWCHLNNLRCVHLLYRGMFNFWCVKVYLKSLFVCVNVRKREREREQPLLSGIKMASVLFLALCWTHAFKNSRGSAGDTCRGSSLPPCHIHPAPAHSQQIPPALTKQDGAQI